MQYTGGNRSLTGGFAMLLEQFYLGCLSQASYMVGSDGEAAVIDPRRDIEEYLASIDTIEEATGLDFLTALSDQTQQEIESVTPTEAW